MLIDVIVEYNSTFAKIDTALDAKHPLHRLIQAIELVSHVQIYDINNIAPRTSYN